MPYYSSEIYNKNPELVKYFTSAIKDESKNVAHCLLFWGGDTKNQCELALELARLLNCKKDGAIDCDCQNCRWIREQTHPAVKIYTRLDFKESDNNSDDEEKSTGKKNINVAQARAIISELLVSSDYHRVYIFCDRDEDGNLLPLNQQNFPEVTSNALLKTFEEPPSNTTFIFLTKDKTDVISTVVSRAQAFFVPAVNTQERDYNIVRNFISDYWKKERSAVLDFASEMQNLVSDYDEKIIFEQMQNYIFEKMREYSADKNLFYKFLRDLKYVEEASRQASLIPPMNSQTICENLSFKMLLS